jgi:hypothetical protein
MTPIPCNEEMRANLHGQASDAYVYVSHDVSYKNKLPYICSMYATGVKVLSMKINYLAPFKHKHKHQKLVHEK